MSAEALNWVNTTLASKMVVIDGVTYLQTAPDVVMAPGDFVTIFGASIDGELAKVPADRNFYVTLPGTQTFTYDGVAYTQTAAELGYQPTFDQWHTEGII